MANNKSKKKKQKNQQKKVHNHHKNSLQSGALFGLGKELAISIYDFVSSWVEIAKQLLE